MLQLHYKGWYRALVQLHETDNIENKMSINIRWFEFQKVIDKQMKNYKEAYKHGLHFFGFISLFLKTDIALFFLS